MAANPFQTGNHVALSGMRHQTEVQSVPAAANVNAESTEELIARVQSRF